MKSNTGGRASDARRRMIARVALLACLVGPFGSGCSDDDGPSAAVVNLISDRNRNGRLDVGDPPEDDGEESWTPQAGAMFLVNADDDDEDGLEDDADGVVNGANDELDLARVATEPWPAAPLSALGELALDPAVSPYVRVFRRDGAGWSPFESPMTLTAKELRSGVELGIEALDFVRGHDDAWQGKVRLTLTVSDGGRAVGSDDVELRVAPWLMNHNLRAFDTVYFSEWSDDYVSSVRQALDQVGVGTNTFPNDYTHGWGDIWFEDFFQTGSTGIPSGPDGQVHGMAVYNPRPWGRDDKEAHLPLTFLRSRMLGPDRGVAVFFDVASELNHGSTFDSHGNHEMLPPYAAAPAGRMLLGSGILASTRRFYAAQAQPPVYVDTDWLLVGHVDEVYAAVRADTPRGWKLLENTPSLCRDLLEGWQAAGHGSAPVFPGRTGTDGGDWERTLSDLLADPVLMAWNQEAQAAIDLMHDHLMEEVGLSEDEFVHVPVLYQEIDGGKIAYLPDTVNTRVVQQGTVAIFAEPVGPIIDGKDALATYLQQALVDPAARLGADGEGLDVHFADSWAYHVVFGDVHCASNWSAPPKAGEPMGWEAVK